MIPTTPLQSELKPLVLREPEQQELRPGDLPVPVESGLVRRGLCRLVGMIRPFAMSDQVDEGGMVI